VGSTVPIPESRAATLSGPSRRPVHRSCDGVRGARIGPAGGHQQPRVLRLELGEVVKRVVLPEIVVLHVVLFDVPLVRRGNQDRAAADAAQQPPSPRRGGGRVDGPAHPR